jgi:hypothetical protein
VNRHRTPAELVVHAAKLCDRGVICPAESWHIISDATAELEVRVLLNTLSHGDQQLVRRNYSCRPLSLEVLAQSYADANYAALLEWCIESASAHKS